MANDKKAPKAKKNELTSTVVAALPNAVKVLKGVVVAIEDTTVRFSYQRPHTNTWNERTFTWDSVISVTGKPGKIGEIVFIDSSEITKREGPAEVLKNGLIRVSDEDRNQAPRVTHFNPKFASLITTGLGMPDASTGWKAKVSKPKAAAPTGEKKKVKKV